MEAESSNPSIQVTVKKSNHHGISYDFGLFGDPELESLLGFGRTKGESFWFLYPILIIMKRTCLITMCQRTWRGCDRAQPTNSLKWREHDRCWHSSPTKVSKGRSNPLNILVWVYHMHIGMRL